MFSFRRRKASPLTVLLLGGLITLIGLAWLVGTARFVSRAHRTMGIIAELTKHTGMVDRTADNRGSPPTESAPVYRPIIRFYDQSGNLRDVMESVGTSWQHWRVNQAVPILYAPDDPSRACIDSFLTVWMGPLILLAMGTVVLLIGKAAWTAQRLGLA